MPEVNIGITDQAPPFQYYVGNCGQELIPVGGPTSQTQISVELNDYNWAGGSTYCYQICTVDIETRQSICCCEGTGTVDVPEPSQPADTPLTYRAAPCCSPSGGFVYNVMVLDNNGSDFEGYTVTPSEPGAQCFTITGPGAGGNVDLAVYSSELVNSGCTDVSFVNDGPCEQCVYSAYPCYCDNDGGSDGAINVTFTDGFIPTSNTTFWYTPNDGTPARCMNVVYDGITHTTPLEMTEALLLQPAYQCNNYTPCSNDVYVMKECENGLDGPIIAIVQFTDGYELPVDQDGYAGRTYTDDDGVCHFFLPSDNSYADWDGNCGEGPNDPTQPLLNLTESDLSATAEGCNTCLPATEVYVTLKNMCSSVEYSMNLTIPNGQQIPELYDVYRVNFTGPIRRNYHWLVTNVSEPSGNATCSTWGPIFDDCNIEIIGNWGQLDIWDNSLSDTGGINNCYIQASRCDLSMTVPVAYYSISNSQYTLPACGDTDPVHWFTPDFGFNFFFVHSYPVTPPPAAVQSITWNTITFDPTGYSNWTGCQLSDICG